MKDYLSQTFAPFGLRWRHLETVDLAQWWVTQDGDHLCSILKCRETYRVSWGVLTFKLGRTFHMVAHKKLSNFRMASLDAAHRLVIKHFRGEIALEPAVMPAVCAADCVL